MTSINQNYYVYHVKFINGKWEYFYGGFLPVKEGVIADLILNEGSVKE